MPGLECYWQAHAPGEAGLVRSRPLVCPRKEETDSFGFSRHYDSNTFLKNKSYEAFQNTWPFSRRESMRVFPEHSNVSQ